MKSRMTPSTTRCVSASPSRSAASTACGLELEAAKTKLAGEQPEDEAEPEAKPETEPESEATAEEDDFADNENSRGPGRELLKQLPDCRKYRPAESFGEKVRRSLF